MKPKIGWALVDKRGRIYSFGCEIAIFKIKGFAINEAEYFEKGAYKVIKVEIREVE